jgi:hypothetical protein
MSTIAFLAFIGPVAMPASAQDDAAARAACTTYAEVKNGVIPSASPRLDQPEARGPSARGVQAPGTGLTEPELARQDPAFRQTFQNCMARLGDETMPSASPRLDAPLSRPATPGVQAPGTGTTNGDMRR